MPGLKAGQIYAFRAIGVNAPELGQCFDPEKVFLDPYGRAVAMPTSYSHPAAAEPGDNCASVMKSVVVDNDTYDWGGDQPLHCSSASTVIYEMHVRGFTRYPNSSVPSERRGTYARLVDKIPYLQELGVTAVELLPVYHFDPTTAMGGMTNYRGYQPISFFAPYTGYSSAQSPLGVLDEFRAMVKAVHKAASVLYCCVLSPVE